MRNNIGFACHVLGMPHMQLRSCSLKNATESTLVSIGTHNIDVLSRMVEYCHAKDIFLFRISSDIIPFGSHPGVTFQWAERFADTLGALGRRIQEIGLRVSMHPGQYTVLNSPDETVWHNAERDLAYHAAFLDTLGLDAGHKLVLHLGGVYGDRSKASACFCERCKRLPDHVLSRLVLENDDRCYPIDAVLRVCRAVSLPAVFDVLHHRILPPSTTGTLQYWLTEASDTWKRADGRQKIHYAEQRPGGRPGMHSNTISPHGFTTFYQETSFLPLDIMLEVKDKNISALKCLHITATKPSAQDLYSDWARYKYAVLEKSHKIYLEIRSNLAADTLSPLLLFSLCDRALALPYSSAESVNAAQHVWGHVKKDASEKEKTQFHQLVSNLVEGAGALTPLKRFLKRLVIRCNCVYLYESVYFVY